MDANFRCCCWSAQEDVEVRPQAPQRVPVFRLRSKFLPSCPGQERSERKPYYWMPVSQVHSLPMPKGTGYNKLCRSFPSFTYITSWKTFWRCTMKAPICAAKIQLLSLYLTKCFFFLEDSVSGCQWHEHKINSFYILYFPIVVKILHWIISRMDCPWGGIPLFVFTQAWPHFQVVTWEGQWREGGMKGMMRRKTRRREGGGKVVFTEKGQRSDNQKCPFIGYIIKPQGAHQCRQSGMWIR